MDDDDFRFGLDHQGKRPDQVSFSAWVVYCAFWGVLICIAAAVVAVSL